MFYYKLLASTSSANVNFKKEAGLSPASIRNRAYFYFANFFASKSVNVGVPISCNS